jgi:chromosome partitioning protein
MQQRIVVTNRKGGVGKTTLALHLAALSQSDGVRTLLVDLDPQGSATGAALGYATEPPASALAENLWSDDPADRVQPVTTAWGFDLLAASRNLSGVDALPYEDTQAAFARLPSDYGLVVFDTPPTAGALQSVPLVSARALVVPVEPDAFAVQGLSHLSALVQSVRQANPGLAVFVVANRLKRRAKRQWAVVEHLRQQLGQSLADPPLTEREIVRHSRDAGVPVWDYAPKDPAAQAWKQACHHILTA